MSLAATDYVISIQMGPNPLILRKLQTRFSHVTANPVGGWEVVSHPRWYDMFIGDADVIRRYLTQAFYLFCRTHDLDDDQVSWISWFYGYGADMLDMLYLSDDIE